MRHVDNDFAPGSEVVDGGMRIPEYLLKNRSFEATW